MKNLLKFILPLILATQMTARAGRIEIRSTEQRTGWVHLRNGAEIPAKSDPASAGLTSRALASADFDEDGMPDLVTGYASSVTGGTVSIQRGNVDAIYPNSPEARARRQRGEFITGAFLPVAKSLVIPEAPDFLGAGDFDADGHWDIVTARNGGDKLYWFRGDGHGGFKEPKIIFLPGAITCLITGE
ncbi:MAG: FG-GAP repeat domain-containing protein, partial [Chthoniobacterales bacterium]